MYKFIALFLLGGYLLPFTIVLQQKYLFEYIQVVTIVSCFFFGGFISTKTIKQACSANYEYYLIPRYKYVLVVAVFYFIFKAAILMEVLSHLFSGDFFKWALENAIQRYESNVKLSVWYQLGTVSFLIYSSLLGAYGWRKKSLILFFIYFLMLIVESAALARAGILIGFCMIFVEFIIRNNKKLSDMSYISYFKLATISVISLGAIFFFSAYFRISHKDNVVEILLEKLSTYTLAMYEALFVWMQQVNAYFFGYGYFTFNPIFRLFGDKPRQGFYLLTETSYGYTNIYTGIRGLLSDFGFLGAAFVVFLAGYKLHQLSKIKANILDYLLLKIIILLIVYILMSPFYFTTVILAYLSSFVYIILFRDKLISKG